MGWTSSYNWDNKKALISYLMSAQYWGKNTVLDHSVYGSELYLLIQKENGSKFIAVYLVRNMAAPFESVEYGYKDMDESMHPNYYNCPERLLKQSDCNAKLSIEWREQCRQKRKEKANAKKKNKTFSFNCGDIWKSKNTGRKVELKYRLNDSYIVGHWENEGTFKVKPTSLIAGYEPV